MMGYRNVGITTSWSENTSAMYQDDLFMILS
jgi:hypothetical protein